MSTLRFLSSIAANFSNSFRNNSKQMKMYKESAGVQEEGCRALLRVLENDNCHETIAAAGGIEAIIEGMGRNREAAGVQVADVWGFAYLHI